MGPEISADTLHRVAKLLLDTGEAATLEAATQKLATYRLTVDVGRDVAHSPTLQAALLTVVNTARRCFLGGVFVHGAVDTELRVTWRDHRRLDAAVADLRGTVVETPLRDVPRIVIGDAAPPSDHPCVLRATFDGWAGGVLPARDSGRLAERQECEPAGVLAGSLAVSEAFQFVRGGNPEAGRRRAGLSLWRPDADGWPDTVEAGPTLEWLPAKLWLIGLGHLGQAYLWTLGFLPYADPGQVRLMLQDHDILALANDSTSPLTFPELVRVKKARAMAQWCEERGFSTAINERRFSADFTVTDDEPQVALCGVDNTRARAALESVGFREIVEAGLGGGTREYLSFLVHSLPGERSAQDRWGTNQVLETAPDLTALPGYRALATDGVDACGLTLLAGRTVGAPFVGTTTAALVVAELLRMALGADRYDVIDGTLRSPSRRGAVARDRTRPPFNPGVTRATMHR